MSASLRDAFLAHTRKVQAVHEHVRGNVTATKQSLIAPVLGLLGYDLSDPRECIAGFQPPLASQQGKGPIDWVVLDQGRPLFFVSAKAAEPKVPTRDDLLVHYFQDHSEASLGVVSNGLTWRFFTDLNERGVLDAEPFLVWDLLGEDPLPIEILNFLAICQKGQFEGEVIRAFAQTNTVRKNLLITELERLLAPSAEFVKLAISNLETRRLTEEVVESWKPIVSNAIQQWARARALTTVISQAHTPVASHESPIPHSGHHQPVPSAPAAAGPGQSSDPVPQPTKPTVVAQTLDDGLVERAWQQMKSLSQVLSHTPPMPEEEPSIRRMVPSDEEPRAFEIAQLACGKERPLGCETTLSSFNLHLPHAPTQVISRIHLKDKEKSIWFPMEPAQCATLGLAIAGRPTPFPNWTSFPLKSVEDMKSLEKALRIAYDAIKAQHSRNSTLSIDYVFEKIA